MLQPARDSRLQGTAAGPDAIEIVELNCHAGGFDVGVEAQRVERRSNRSSHPSAVRRIHTAYNTKFDGTCALAHVWRAEPRGRSV